jgi:hypothetical protein
MPLILREGCLEELIHGQGWPFSKRWSRQNHQPLVMPQGIQAPPPREAWVGNSIAVLPLLRLREVSPGPWQDYRPTDL